MILFYYNQTFTLGYRLRTVGTIIRIMNYDRLISIGEAVGSKRKPMSLTILTTY